MPLPRLLPKPSGNQLPPEPQPAVKRKRGVHHTACNHCRVKREKCSGQRPKCQTCERHGTQCVYEAPQGVTRQQAHKQKLANIERSSTSLREVVELLRHGSEDDAAVALSRIRQAEDVDEAIIVLALAQTLVTHTSSNSGTSSGSPPHTDEDAHTHLPRSLSHDSVGSSLPNGSTEHQTLKQNRVGHTDYTSGQGATQTRDRHNEDAPIDLPTLTLPISKWTQACKDDRLLNHLLTLFWTWDNTVEQSLFRPLFEEELCNNDPQAGGLDSHAFCSPFLVNALLALSCTISDLEDLTTSGQKFAEEAERHLQKEQLWPSIPLLQGQLAMFAYEGNVGAGAKSIDRFMDAMKTYEALNTRDFLDLQGQGKSEAQLQAEKEGLSWIMWGLYCARWRVYHVFGFQKPTAKPDIPKLWQNSTFPLSQSDSTSYWWHPYPTSYQTQRSMRVEIREVDSFLSEVAEDVLNFLHPLPDCSPEPAAAKTQRAIELYNTLVQWKLSLPARLRVEEAVQPRVISLHAYAEVLLLAVLRPFLNLTRSQFGPFGPKGRCYTHCTSLIETIWTFRAFTSLNSEYWFIPMLATIAFMTFCEHAHSPVLTETLIKACKCLHEMTPMYTLAADALSAIRGAFKRAGLPVPTYLQTFLNSGITHGNDGLLHRAVAKLMPGEGWSSDGDELRYQELLEELDDLEIDGVEMDGIEIDRVSDEPNSG